MFGMQPLLQAHHVLLYPIEASAQLHMMFPDGTLQLVVCRGAREHATLNHDWYWYCITIYRVTIVTDATL